MHHEGLINFIENTMSVIDSQQYWKVKNWNGSKTHNRNKKYVIKVKTFVRGRFDKRKNQDMEGPDAPSSHKCCNKKKIKEYTVSPCK